MNFNEWCEKRNHLLMVSGYKGNTEEYFSTLKNKIDELGLNEGLKEIYVKRSGPHGVERFYFIYSEKVSIISLEAMEITVDDFYLSDLETVQYKFQLNSDYEKKLKLKFKNKSLILDPIQDTEHSEYGTYSALLKEIYLLIK